VAGLSPSSAEGSYFLHHQRRPRGWSTISTSIAPVLVKQSVRFQRNFPSFRVASRSTLKSHSVSFAVLFKSPAGLASACWHHLLIPRSSETTTFDRSLDHHTCIQAQFFTHLLVLALPSVCYVVNNPHQEFSATAPTTL
jgi:hypothetical protein